MAVTGPNTGFNTTDPTTGNLLDLGNRYVSVDYLIDVYPNIPTTLGRTAPTLNLLGLSYTFNSGKVTNYAFFTSPTKVSTDLSWKVTSAGTTQLAIKNDGTLWGIGQNTYGELGGFPGTYYISPIQIGALANWKVVSSDTSVSAIKTDGTLWAWGWNAYGQIGNNNITNYSSPVQVGALTNWRQVSVTNTFVNAVKTDGTLWSWGYNGNGQLGNNNITNYSSPVQVGALTNWRQVAVGLSNSIAVKTDGTLWTWGLNTNGQLGNNNNVNYSSPVQVGALTNWRQASIGASSAAAVKTDGTLWTWGLNTNGQLGQTLLSYNNLANALSPVQVGAGTWRTTSASIVSSGYNYQSAAIGSTGGLWTWGSDVAGELGNGGVSVQFTYLSPVQVGALTDWSQVALGTNFTMAVKTGGTLWGWGGNTLGNLGNGNTVSYSSPVQIGALTTWSKISAGMSSSAAIKTDGTLWTWGGGSTGQLGINNLGSYSSPLQVGALTTWSQVAMGSSHTMAIKTDGTLWAWGSNINGQLGYLSLAYIAGINQFTPVQVSSAVLWKSSNTSITYYAATTDNSIGNYNSLFISTTGNLWSCGYNGYGQLGINNLVNAYSSPVQVGALTDWSQVAWSGSSSYAIKTDGTLWTWGYNAFGQLGNNNRTYYSSPVQIGALTNWKQVVPGAAITTTGQLFTWGVNQYGQLGRGFVGATAATGGYYSSPVQVGALTNWSQVSTGTYCTAAVKTDGTLWAWGWNAYGQLGTNNTTYYSSPVQIGALTNWKQVSVGMSHTVAVKTDGTLWGWGQNATGNLGIGNATSYSSPVQIGALTTWRQVASNNNFTLAVKTDNTLWAWGNNNQGQLGINAGYTNYSSPVQVGVSTNWNEVAAVTGHSVAYASDNSAWTWGSNTYGQLAAQIPYNLSVSSPVQVGALTTWSQISAGPTNSAAIKTDGTLWVWGTNTYGQLGNNNVVTYSSPIQIGALTDWSRVSVGTSFTIALKTNGTVWSWGSGASGQLGLGGTSAYSSPVQVGTLTTWTDVVAGQGHNMIFGNTNQLYTTGNNTYGQIGAPVPAPISVSSPIQVGTLTGWKHVEVGVNWMMALRSNGSLWAWGYDNYGTLGLGIYTTASYSSPIQVGTLTTWKYISAKGANSFNIADGYS